MNNKEKRKHDILIRSFKFFNILLITGAFFVSLLYLYINGEMVKPIEIFWRFIIVLLFLILYCKFGQTYDAFSLSYNRLSEMIYSQFLSILFSNFIIYFVICILEQRFISPFVIVVCIIIQSVLSTIWCCLANTWYFHKFKARKTIIVYDMREGMDHVISQYKMEKKFDIVGNYRIDEFLNNKDLILKGNVEAIFLCGIHSHDRNVILKDCIEQSIVVFVIPRVGDVIMSSAKEVHLFHLPILRVDRYNPNPEFSFIKRAFDIIVSGLAIVLMSPFLLITAIAVKSDGGPALYKQVRLTKDGKEFKILKFRSMRIDAEKDGVARLSTGDHDNRITKVGKIIRKIRFDELPQLFNIFIGDMSIVGPRPERPEIARQYETKMPEFKLRLQAKAGLTGYAQVYGKYNTTPYDKLQMDLMYIAHPSILADLRICFATVKILFLPESTEGVDPGQVTALDYENEANRTEKEEKRGEHWAN